ncbi:hypothetical protein B0H14DRAFT_2564878 [Mycena olivaceomarginata]|nr:hypothetical protein B0H14DRAFT_2564878 [Mycena olivaceomarginata]
MVPQELLDDMLADLDEDSLHACALASRRFLLPAQRLLFKEMSFPMQQNFRGVEKGISNPITLLVQRASDILSSSPQLLAFVRELNIGSMYWKEGWDALEVLLRTLRPGKIKCFSMEGAMEAMPQDVCSIAGIQTAANVSLSPAIHAEDGGTPLECLAMHIRDGAGDFLVQPRISRLISGLRKLEIFADALGAAHFCSRTLMHLKLHIPSVSSCYEAGMQLHDPGGIPSWRERGQPAASWLFFPGVGRWLGKK